MVEYSAIFSGVTLLILLLGLVTPWISVVGTDYSMMSFINMKTGVFKPPENGGMMNPEMEVRARDFANMIIVSMALFILAVISAVAGFKFETGLLFSGVFALLSSIIFIFGLENFLSYIASQMGIFGGLTKVFVQKGAGVYITMLGGGIAIVGYIISRFLKGRQEAARAVMITGEKEE